MSKLFGIEIGSPANQASQRAVRNGWIASFIHVITAFAYGGFYQPTWITGNMIEGVIFALLALTVPITMAVVGITSYKLHYRKLMQANEKSKTAVLPSEIMVAAE